MFAITILAVLITLAAEITVSLLNYSYRSHPIPDNVTDVYDGIQYRRWLDYTMETHKLSMLSKIVNGLATLGMLLLGGFPLLARLTDSLTRHPILRILAFLALLYFLHYLLNLGFKLYRTFGIEARYGFNKTTPKIFIADQLKSLSLSLLLSSALLYSLLWLYLNHFGSTTSANAPTAWIPTWLAAWLMVTAVILVMNLLYTKVFIRLFNTLTPLTEGPLHDQIVALAQQTGYSIKAISIMNASKRSTRLNAFFSGFGRFKHIVLYDNLIEKCATDEVVAVLAHEIGHAKHKDVLKNFLQSTLQIGATLALLLYFLSASGPWAAAFGFSEPHLGFALVLFGLLTEPLGLLLSLPLTALSRKAEYLADGYAATLLPQAMIRALKVLARENFSNLTPHPFAVKLTYTHPPISQRIAAIERIERIALAKDASTGDSEASEHPPTPLKSK